MHVAILVTALGAGGAEQVIAQLSRHLALNGRRVTLISFDAPDDLIYHGFDNRVELVRLGCANSGTTGNLRKIFRLRGALRATRPDLLLSFLTKNNLLASIAIVGLPIRWIACERNNPERQQANPLWNALLRITYRRADAIVCQTAAVQRCFPRAVKSRLHVIPNPIAPSDAKPTGSGSRLVAVGRLDRQKGFDILIDAFARVASLHPEWQLQIWGEGPERANLEKRIADHAMIDRIILRGVSAQPRGWIAEADVFVLSSRYEGFPNVLGEALSAGLPVIATDCDFGPSEMVSHGIDGWLVPSEQPAALISALDRVLGDATLRSRLASRARAAAERFAPPGVMAEWERLIEAVVNCEQAAQPSVPALAGKDSVR